MMINFSYIHVHSNHKLENFTKEALQTLHSKATISTIHVVFKKMFDLKNRTREVAQITINSNDRNISCEIASLNFKKSIRTAVKSLENQLVANEDLMSA